MRWLRAALVAAVIFDFLIPTGGLIQADAQSAGVKSGISQNDRLCSWIGSTCLIINPDGSINARITPALTYPTQVAGNCSAANGAVTVSTNTPPPGQSVYVIAWRADVLDDGTGGTVQAAATWPTLGNISYGGSAGTFKFSFPDTANTTQNVINDFYNPPLKAIKPGVNVSSQTPTASLHTIACSKITYYIAP